MRGRRGQALQFLVVVLAMLLVSGVLISRRASIDHLDRDAARVRTQALWLARSALDTGVSGSRDVETPVGTAHVEVTGAGAGRTVTVTLRGTVADVQEMPYRERYTPAASAL